MVEVVKIQSVTTRVVEPSLVISSRICRFRLDRCCLERASVPFLIGLTQETEHLP